MLQQMVHVKLVMNQGLLIPLSSQHLNAPGTEHKLGITKTVIAAYKIHRNCMQLRDPKNNPLTERNGFESPWPKHWVDATRALSPKDTALTIRPA